jgi:hypothetical protein
MTVIDEKTTLRTSLNQSAADGWWWQSRFCTGRCHLMNRDKTRLAAPHHQQNGYTPVSSAQMNIAHELYKPRPGLFYY